VSAIKILLLYCADRRVVVGDQEMNGREVNVRNRDDTSSQDRGKPVPLQEAITKLVALRDERRSDNPFPGDAKVEKGEQAKTKA
jgi:threonyl-tRNA synthetase